MKTLTSILLLSSLFASAQTASMVRTNMFIASTVTNSALYTYPGTNVVDVSRYANVGWEITFAGSGANTNSIIVTFLRSPDGTNYETAPLYSWTVTSQGTNVVRAITNFPAAPAFLWKPYQITNSMGTDVTNAALYGLKRAWLTD